MLLLLTGTIDPSVYNNTNVVLVNAEERLNQYIDTIKRYINTGIFKNIVFAENSGYPFPTEEIRLIAQKHNSNFELVNIKSDIQETIKKGKSYGEADCIEKGLCNSKLAKNEEYFIKCTGRVFVKNIRKICSGAECNKFFFKKNWCYTVLFQANIKEYLTNFSVAKDICDETKGIDIETAFYRIIVDNHIEYKVLKPYPFFCGICGTNGISYNEDYYIKSFFTRLGIIGDKESFYYDKLSFLQDFWVKLHNR